MPLFCRNCGKELVVTPTKSCSNCGAHPVKASAFCRYCGHPTSPEDVICPACGVALKPISSRLKDLGEKKQRLVKLGKILSLTIVVALVTLYVVFSLPPSVTKPIKSAVSDLVVATVGYTSFPLSSISAAPFEIPLPINTSVGGNVAVFTINQTQQLTVNALYKNTTNKDAEGSGRTKDVTTNCTYQSSNSQVAIVTTSGLVRGVAPGSALITISYTAVPGSANISSAAEGKVPITVTTRVPVTVSAGPATLLAEDQP